MTTSTQSEDELNLAGSDESTTDSDEGQNGGVEDNSHDESKKVNSNFKKLSKKAKTLERNIRNPDFLRAQLAKIENTDGDDDGDDESDEDVSFDTVVPFSDARSEIWFIKNPDAEEYKESMAELIEENPTYSRLSKDDLFVLAKEKYPKSSSKRSFDMGNGKTNVSSKSKPLNEYTDDEIAAMPAAEYKRLFMAGKK